MTSLASFAFCFSVLIAVFHKQVNICCSIGSISKPRSSRNRKAADQAIAMDSYQSYFRKFDIFFSRKQQGAIRTDRKIYYNAFQGSCITLNIFDNSTFFGATEHLFSPKLLPRTTPMKIELGMKKRF